MLGAVTGVVNIEMGEDKNVKFTLPNGQLALTSLDPESFPSWLARAGGLSRRRQSFRFNLVRYLQLPKELCLCWRKQRRACSTVR